jgi:hypothetical protein
VPPYLAMSLLCKKSNRVWHWLIRNDLVHTVWSPLVERTRCRHVAFRRRLAERRDVRVRSGSVVSAGVCINPCGGGTRKLLPPGARSGSGSCG